MNGRPSIEVDAANKTEKWNADAQAGGIKLSTYGGYTGLSLEESEVRISMFSPKLMRQMSLTADSADCSIKLSTKETNYNEVSLADYPINWSAIKNKPTGSYVQSVTTQAAAPGGNSSYTNNGIYFYTGESDCNYIAFVCNDREANWGWHYDYTGKQHDLNDSILKTGTNMIPLAVYKYNIVNKSF